MGDARKNLLSVWSDRSYQLHMMRFKLLNQPYFVCNSPDSVRHVFLDHHDNYDRKSPQMRHALEPLLGDSLFISDGELWRERRRACAPAFQKELMPAFAEVMTDTANEVAQRWANTPSGTPIDVLNEMARLTARIIGRTVFGDDVPEPEAAQVVRGFTAYQSVVEQLDFADTFGLPFLKAFGNPLRRRQARRHAALVHEVIDRIIARHRSANVRRQLTLLSILLDGATGVEGAEPGCPLGREAARNEAILMFMAGHETTANALAWTWYLLDGSPSARHALHEELDKVLQGRLPQLDDVPNLPYTRAVFEEALRLYPPVPLLSRQARGPDVIRGKEIAPNTIILVLPWLLHRHQRFWPEPNAFKPERFMPGAPKPDKFLYIPFSVGQRVCLGMRFGLTEAILCLATLAQRFQPRLVPGHRVEIECRLTLRPRGGLPMFVEPRTTG